MKIKEERNFKIKNPFWRFQKTQNLEDEEQLTN
jgi:hypothetical protein